MLFAAIFTRKRCTQEIIRDAKSITFINSIWLEFYEKYTIYNSICAVNVYRYKYCSSSTSFWGYIPDYIREKKEGIFFFVYTRSPIAFL